LSVETVPLRLIWDDETALAARFVGAEEGVESPSREVVRGKSGTSSDALGGAVVYKDSPEVKAEGEISYQTLHVRVGQFLMQPIAATARVQQTGDAADAHATSSDSMRTEPSTENQPLQWAVTYPESAPRRSRSHRARRGTATRC
jgi:hypothetical protein